jgi:hypothetical protein
MMNRWGQKQPEVNRLSGVNHGGSRVFVSYSRKDKAFVEKLTESLTSRKREVWVDWQDIPPTADWLNECLLAIDGADTFVFVISPASVASEICSRELAHAISQSKRIVPVLLEAVSPDSLPEPIRRINWVSVDSATEFDSFIQRLEQGLDLDLPWLRLHTRILVRAREWETKQKASGYLLSASDLDEAQQWLAGMRDHEPAPTALHVEYISASQQWAAVLQRRQLRKFYIGSMVVAFSNFWLIRLDGAVQDRLQGVFATGTWILPLIFGLSGFTIGRNRLLWVIIITVAGVYGLYCVLMFIAFVWDPPF